MTALIQSMRNDQQRRDVSSPTRFVVRFALQALFDDRQSDVRERASRLLSTTP